jgi:hypothetical protein
MVRSRSYCVTDPHDPASAQAETPDTDARHEPHGAEMPHDAPDDIADHGEADHTMAALGPVDVEAWLAGALGIALGLVVGLCLVIAVSI